jgi:MFS family permease
MTMDLSNEDKSQKWKPTFQRRWLVYTLICFSTIIQGMITAGFVNTSFTTIERKFHFSSTTTGFISGAAPLGSLIFIIPWSHLSDHKGASKLRYFGAGLFTMAIGSLCYCLPHFISKPISRNTQSTLSNSNICLEGSETRDIVITENFSFGILFFIGNFLHGAGSSCFFPIGAAYLSVIIKDSPGWITLWTALFVVGPALGYAVGGQLLRVDADIDRQSSHANQPILEEQWLGAWWISFVLSSATCFALSVIYFGGNTWLSKKISDPDSSDPQQRDLALTERTNVLKQMWEQIKKLPGDILKMLKLKVYVLVLIFLSSDGVIITSLAAFLPKYLETQVLTNQE